MSAPARRRFDAIIFDNDGLLLETEGAWTLAEERLFARYGHEFTIEHKREILGKGGPLAEEALARLLDRPLINFGRSSFEGYPRAGKKMATGFAPRREDQFVI